MVLLKHHAAFAAIPRNKNSLNSRGHRQLRRNGSNSHDYYLSGGILRHKITRKRANPFSIAGRGVLHEYVDRYMLGKEIVDQYSVQNSEKQHQKVQTRKSYRAGTKRRNYSLDKARRKSNTGRRERRHSSSEMYCGNCFRLPDPVPSASSPMKKAQGGVTPPVYNPTYGTSQQGYHSAPVYVAPNPISSFQRKSIVEAYILNIALGWLGAHHFYLNRPGWGVLYFFTLGLLGAGYIMDLFRMPLLVKNANERMQDPTLNTKLRLDDAYVLWFPFGLLGFHHFYLRNHGLGVVYFCTLGLFGIGWLLDLFLIPKYVKNANKENVDNGERSVCTAYLLAISPFGIFGAQHFYLNRILFGILYFFTFGLLGIGYLVDICRVPFLVQRYNKNRKSPDMPQSRYVDDAYLLWFPLGVLGFHHFYLNRPGWGFLYMFTLGIFGIGWLVDACRIPGLVKDYNRMVEERRGIPTVRGPLTTGYTITGNSPQGPYIQTSVGVSNVTVTGNCGTVPPPYGASGGYQQPQYPQQQFYPQQQGYLSQPPNPQGYPSQKQGYDNQNLSPPDNPPPYTAPVDAEALPKKE